MLQIQLSVCLKANFTSFFQETYIFPDVPLDPFHLSLGMDEKQFIDFHFMNNMLAYWFNNWLYLQIVTHQFLYVLGQMLPKNSILTLKSLVNHGFCNYEFDIIAIYNGYIVDHNFLLFCNVGIDGKHYDLSDVDIIGNHYLIKQFTKNTFTANYKLRLCTSWLKISD